MSKLERKHRLDEANRVWQPDLNNVIDWGLLWDAGVHVNAENPQATWWLQATPGVNYVRGELPARALPGRAIQLEVRDLQEDKDGMYFPRQGGDAAVWLFPGNTTRALLMAEMKEQGYRVIVEVDDNYTAPFRAMSGSEWLNKRDTSGKDRSSLETHQKIVRQIADAVIVSTPKLAEVYSALHREIYVCPNQVAPEDWPAEPEHQPDGVLRIGWAGSDSHIFDLNDIMPALDWASRQKDVEIVIMGGLDVRVPARRIPWAESMHEYRAAVQNIDVMLCPLRPSAYADGKSDLKALEAAMSLAVPIVSEVEAYKPWWQNEEAPCMLAKDSKGFTKAVKELVGNRGMTRYLAESARSWVLENRSIHTGIEHWREALRG